MCAVLCVINSVIKIIIMNKPWYHPDELIKNEREIRRNDNNLDLRNDFASYKNLLNTRDLYSSKIIFHNDINPNFKIKEIIRFITNRLFNKVTNYKYFKYWMRLWL